MDDYSALPHTPRATDAETTYPLTHQFKRELPQPTRWSIMRPWRTASGGRLHVRREKGGAKEAILSEYERWSKKHPDDATMMSGFLFAGDDG